MNQRTQELTAAWLEKAGRDLQAAERLIAGENPLADVGVFHCQQTAEKAMKAWLTHLDVIFPKTHSLVKLLSICVETLPDFIQFENHAFELTPLGTEFRYPGDFVEPSPERSFLALALAKEIYIFCEAAIRKGAE